MIKRFFLCSLTLSLLIGLNCNMAYSKENDFNEPYKTLEELKQELRDERRQIEQERLEEIKKKEQEKKEQLGEEEKLKENKEDKKSEKKENENKENENIPSLIVRLRGKHSTKYLCSYNFTVEEENTKKELNKTNIDDYNVLLKKPSLKVRAGEVINFEFSEKPTKIKTYIWDDNFTEIEVKRGCIKVPDLDKKIVVAVEGTYDNGTILYAVVLDIRG